MQKKNSVFFIENLSFPASCETIRNKVSTLNGIEAIEISHITHIMEVSYDADVTGEDEIIGAVGECGYRAYIGEPAAADFVKEKEKADLPVMSALILLCLSILVIRFAGIHPAFCLIPCMLVCFLRYTRTAGYTIFRPALAVFCLMCGVYFMFTDRFACLYFFHTAVLITVDYFSAEFIRRNTAGSHAARRLQEELPQTASVYNGPREKRENVADIRKDQLILIRPGEMIPADGKVVRGFAIVDESSLTGQEKPLEKSEGSYVYAHSVCVKGSITFKAEKIGTRTAMMHYIQLAEQTAGDRSFHSPFQSYKVYLFVFCIFCSLIAFFGWLFTGKDINFALTVMISVLACASVGTFDVVLETEVMKAARQAISEHIIFRNAEALELVGKTENLVLDQENTLTDNSFVITDFIPADSVSADYFEYVAYALESTSSKPFGQAVIRYLRKKKITGINTAEFTKLSARGRSAIKSMQKYNAGTFDEILGLDIDPGDWRKTIEELRNEGKRVLIFTEDRSIIGIAAGIHPLIPGALESVEKLKNEDMNIYLLTVGTPEESEVLGKTTGIENIIHHPDREEKDSLFAHLQEQDGISLYMTGNYIPSKKTDLTAAVAAAGSDQGEADILFTRNRLADFIRAMQLSKQLNERIMQKQMAVILVHSLLIIASGFAFPALAGIPLLPFFTCTAALLIMILSAR